VKIARFATAQGTVRCGIVREGTIELVAGDALGPRTRTGETMALADVKLLAPVAPPNILCIGRNYADHATELGNDLPKAPLLFMKATTALNDPDGDVVLPAAAPGQVDYEAELAVVIGTRARQVGEQDALAHVLGYTCANDVSARDWQKDWGGSQWCRGKTFDTFAPLGPCMVTPDEIPNPNALAIRTRLNGEVMQESNTADMIFDVPTLIEFLSGSTTLFPGTVILTGTPSGVGMARKPPIWLKPGDTVEIEIENIGTLSNPVELEKA
jgi:2-keto-4-pentenoate hydratase/2-oxohepta-3-ene-1,7-dioic acid hydratase in catechol pathway